MAGSLHAQPSRSLADLTLEELAQIEVTTVLRRSERLLDAPASVYVITQDDIRRAGVRTLPEALRLAPNLQVARLDSAQYAISARGFNNAVGNKLLVLVDGRTIYTPLFSGVFWDQQDLMLEDVERIEVISGPGATLWGANAVNGVINVITRSAAESQGVLASAGAGTQDRSAAMRYGGTLPGGHYRFYAKTRTQEATRFAPGGAPPPFPPTTEPLPRTDGREYLQAGFRADWSASGDRFTLQGDVYEGTGEDPAAMFGFRAGRYQVTGANLLARWTRVLADGGDLRVQAYVDHSGREDRSLFQAQADIFDLEFQRGMPLGEHRLLWGAGWRHGRDDVDDALLSGLRPKRESLDWYNVFAQAEIALSGTLSLIPGLKFEYNEYSGTEPLPSVRLAWKPAPERLVWAAASRAVRAPSRLDRDVVIPTPFLLPLLDAVEVGGKNFDSEVANVYELGYRAQVGASFSYSATLFRHEWDRLRSGAATGNPLRPIELTNQIEGTVYGLEAWANWRVTQAWRLSGGFFTLRKDLRLEPGATDVVGPDNITLAADPEHQWTLRSSHDLGSRQALDVFVRHVARLPAAREGAATVAPLPAYTAVDLRYAWTLARDTELSVTVQNLTDRRHAEFRTTGTQPPVEIERSVFVGLRWSP